MLSDLCFPLSDRFDLLLPLWFLRCLPPLYSLILLPGLPADVYKRQEQGMLMIQGEELHVTKLTVEKGEVEIEGLVYSMVYSDDGYMKGEKGGLLRRLFH